MRSIPWIQASALVVLFLLCGPVVMAGSDQRPARDKQGTMTFLAEIDKVRNNYVLRADKPMEVFTILNPEPQILDPYILSGQSVEVEVRVVSGDNITITTLDGKKYGPPAQ